jgi:hypothetical protein
MSDAAMSDAHTLFSRDAIRDAATDHRTALLLGLRAGAAVVAWADEVIHAVGDPPTALFEVSLTPPDDLSALRDALAPLCVDPVPDRTIGAMLELVAADLASGRRNAADTVRVLAQMRRLLPLRGALADMLDQLEDGHMLAIAGLGLTVEEAEQRVHEWMRAMGSRAAADAPPPGSP